LQVNTGNWFDYTWRRMGRALGFPMTVSGHTRYKSADKAVMMLIVKMVVVWL
jgi:hypothetical protein